jgi:alpha-tubulin suppressor-like RCC1 family protein
MLRKTPIVAISCGSYHSIAIDNEHQIYCWGEARFGQTGNGKKSKETIPTLVKIEVDVSMSLLRVKRKRLLRLMEASGIRCV